VWTTSTADDQQSTQVSENSGDVASWNEKFSIDVQDSSIEHLFVEVVDKNYLLNNRLIGKAKFACSDLNATLVEAWIRIYREDGADAGEVLIGASLE
jgi:Ca2+-dependent lipid-binding protein